MLSARDGADHTAGDAFGLELRSAASVAELVRFAVKAAGFFRGHHLFFLEDECDECFDFSPAFLLLYPDESRIGWTSPLGPVKAWASLGAFFLLMLMLLDEGNVCLLDDSEARVALVVVGVKIEVSVTERNDLAGT